MRDGCFGGGGGGWSLGCRGCEDLEVSGRLPDGNIARLMGGSAARVKWPVSRSPAMLKCLLASANP